MPFIGQEPITGAFHKLDAITTSSTNTYNLLLNGGAYSPASANNLMVSLNGVIQSPGSSFTVSGSQITFVPSSGTLSSSDSIDFIMAYGDVLNIGTPSDGSVNTNQLANDAVTTAKISDSAITTGKLPAGSILQVKSTTKVNGFSSTSSSYVDIPGMAISITPTRADSKILIRIALNYGGANNAYPAWLVQRNIGGGSYSTVTISTAAPSSGTQTSFSTGGDNDNHTYKLNSAIFEFLDDPQTTQQCNYKLQGKNGTSVTYEFCVNEINATDNDVYSHGGTSTITVMEIAT